MTLEEIKAEIKKIIKDIKPESRSGSLYYTGMIFGYQTVIDMLNRLEPSWHPYTDEKPPKDGELYWVTLDYDGTRIVTEDLFLNGKFVNYSEYAIVAWAEYNRPNPCEGEAYEH